MNKHSFGKVIRRWCALLAIETVAVILGNYIHDFMRYFDEEATATQ
jgi:hypothetical protein